MKFFHLSDLHLGKRVNEFSMIEDQRYILKKIVNAVDEENPDGILIAGDVYDKSVPSEDAMKLWDEFLLALAKRRIPVYVISGNHDSAVRLSEHNELVDVAGIHLAPAYDGQLRMCSLSDQYGEVHIYMLPFIKPAMVRSFFPDVEIKDYTDACATVVKKAAVDVAQRNILIAHQFVTGATTCESEEHVVGGLDNVNGSAFEVFDYVALGHIHGGQNIGRETVRYCGTPLKYSFSEKNHEKSITVVELGVKGDVSVRTLPLIPMHDMREIKGTYAQVMARENYEGTATEDYIQIILTDEEDVPDAMAKLRTVYPNLMKLGYDNRRTRENREITDASDVEHKSPMELFEEFYELQNNQEMSEQQRSFVGELIASVWRV